LPPKHFKRASLKAKMSRYSSTLLLFFSFWAVENAIAWKSRLFLPYHSSRQKSLIFGQRKSVPTPSTNNRKSKPTKRDAQSEKWQKKKYSSLPVYSLFGSSCLTHIVVATSKGTRNVMLLPTWNEIQRQKTLINRMHDVAKNKLPEIARNEWIYGLYTKPPRQLVALDGIACFLD
jgi:hypothetical protein